MTDKELLELAAKAAGWTIEENGHDVQGHPWFWCHQLQDHWDPIIDDGDALRLAVKLNIDISHSWVVVSGDDRYPMASIHAHCNEIESFYELKESDPYAATRRAIVNVAAEIGKAMK